MEDDTLEPLFYPVSNSNMLYSHKAIYSTAGALKSNEKRDCK